MDVKIGWPIVILASSIAFCLGLIVRDIVSADNSPVDDTVNKTSYNERKFNEALREQKLKKSKKKSHLRVIK